MSYFTNTTANAVLSNTALDFDGSKVNLMTVQGNDANNWGTAGSNGAAVTFTGLGETLSGNIDVDTISSLNLYLLQNTTYTGATSISTNSVNTRATDSPITVNLDSTSKWIVTGNSTVTNLNAAAGSSIVDESGNTVTIVANDTTVVKGSGNCTVTVTGSYSTAVTTGSDNELSTAFIDRTAFDAYYNTNTIWGENGVSTESATSSAQSSNTDAQINSERTTYVLYGVAALAIIAGVSLVLIRRKKTGGNK